MKSDRLKNVQTKVCATLELMKSSVSLAVALVQWVVSDKTYHSLEFAIEQN